MYCENQERLLALYRYDILDTPREELFDEFTRMASAVCGMPIAVLNFLDRDRQWFKSEIGLGIRETPLDVSICQYAVLEHDLFIIEDTLNDERTRNNPVVTARNGLRFYAGAVLRTDEGHAIGTLCVLDHHPRVLTPEQKELLLYLARQIMNRLDLHLEKKRFANAVNSFTETFFTLNHSLRLIHLNAAAVKALGGSDVVNLKGALLTDLTGIDEGHLFVSTCREVLNREEIRSVECEFPTNGRWMEAVLYPSAEGLTVCAKDITDTRAARQRLHLLEACVQALNDLVVITRAESLDGPGPEIIYVNPAFEQLSGYSQEEVLGKSPRFLQGAKTDRKTLDRIHAALFKGESIREEVLNYAKDGQEYWLEMEIQPVRNAAGVITNFISVERDVTERKRMQHRMLRTHRLEGLGALAGGMAHELNNMLGPMLMAANFLEETVTDSQGRELLGMIENGVDNAAKVIRRVLAYARGIGGRRVEHSPADLVADLPLLVSESFDHRIHYQLEAEPDLPMLWGDEEQIESVLDQLAHNACAAMPEGGDLTLSIQVEDVREQDDVLHEPVTPGMYMVFTFSDTGPGVPEALRDKIFEPFFTTRPFGTASGMGLPFVLGILRGHGGFLRMSERPAGGVLMSAGFPLFDRIQKDDEPRQTFPANAKVFIVMSDTRIRRMLLAVLEQEKVQVRLCDTPDSLFGDFPDGPAVVITEKNEKHPGGSECLDTLSVRHPRLLCLTVPSEGPVDMKSLLLGIRNHIRPPS